jgi:hypothetical protein
MRSFSPACPASARGPERERRTKGKGANQAMTIIETAFKKRAQIMHAKNIDLLKIRYHSFLHYCRKHRLSIYYVDWLYLISL